MRHQTHSPEETRSVAREWAASLGAGSVVQLIGDLGAGKTTFVQGLAEGLGCETIPTSPTFSLLHEYTGGRLPLLHWDLYRLGPGTDWGQLDLVDHLPGEGITVVEWPDRYPGVWPAQTRIVRIGIGQDPERGIEIG